MDLLDPRHGALEEALEALLTDVAAYARAGEPFGPTRAGFLLWLRFRRTATVN